MKVLHIINTLSAGGAELHLLTLCRYMKREGIEPVVGFLKEGRGSRPLQQKFEEEGIKVINLKGKHTWDGRYLLRALKLIRQERPDVLHTHLPRADLVGYLSKRVIPSFPWICSVHGIYATHWSGRKALPLFYHVWRQADLVIAISKAVKSWLMQNGKVPMDHVQVVYYGIEPERFRRPTQNLRALLNLGERPIIGSIGRLEPIKGFDLLIRAMPLIIQQVPEATLLIAGHDPWGYGQTLQNLIKRLGLMEQVHLLGFQDDIPSFLHALDVFAFASRSEGFGQVLIEAMAAGKPVVATEIPPLTEIVVNGETGILTEPENPEELAKHISWLLLRPEECHRMGRSGMDRVYDLFSAPNMARSTIQIYERVLRKRLDRHANNEH